MLSSLIVQVRIVLRRTIASSGDCCFDNLSHHQTYNIIQLTLMVTFQVVEPPVTMAFLRTTLT